MPGTRCAVATCSNSLIQTKKANLPISYHTFPKDLNIFDVWVSACQRGDQWNPKTSVICSQHFEEGDFEVDLRSKLMNIRTKRKLKCNAVPSLFLPKLPQTETSATVKCEQVVKQEEFIVEEVVIKTERIDDDEYSTNVAVEQNVAEIPLTDKELPLNKKYQKLMKRHKVLQNKYRVLQQSFKKQTKKLSTTARRLKQITEKLESKYRTKHQLKRKL